MPIKELQDEAIPAMRSAFGPLRGFFHGYDYSAAIDAEPVKVLRVYLVAVDHVLALKLRPADAQQTRQIVDLISAWNSDDYSVREDASARIAKIGLPAEPQLREAMTSTSAEVRLRARRIRSEVLSPQPAVTFEHSGRILSLRFSPDGRWLASAGDAGIVQIRDTSGWKLVQSLSNPTGE